MQKGGRARRRSAEKRFSVKRVFAYHAPAPAAQSLPRSGAAMRRRSTAPGVAGGGSSATATAGPAGDGVLQYALSYRMLRGLDFKNGNLQGAACSLQGVKLQQATGHGRARCDKPCALVRARLLLSMHPSQLWVLLELLLSVIASCKANAW